ncbi:NAD(P)/FAD-dependent oxidoreductase [Pelagibacterium lentulum]|uniref:NADH:ubiquinone reductase (non-electrogenic) n=1 Tax=Pelagibacterium lentulum TaxID=2029865 RepID=A0A916RGS5_9HYPH|nr:NAD(P)/FAD-dependent oxidoreductase [Pelagibacterium lentulum]GGA55407.1 NADH dehydrogenase [Pelagibacterium lentulum]
MDDATEQVIIIGAGFGGLSAAKRLARSGIPFTLIDKRNHHLFQPLLYQVATAALAPSDIAVPIRAVLPPGKTDAQILMDRVDGINTEKKLVHTVGGARLRYSNLIVATGAQYTYFGNDDAWAPHAPSLKSLDDALNIRRRVLLAFERAETTEDPQLRKRLMTFVVIGGGPTGVETAGALAELAKATLAREFKNIDPRSARVVLIEAMDNVLTAYPEHLGRYAIDKLERLGVEVMTGAPVKAIDGHGVTLDDQAIETPNVFWCAGVIATPAGEWLGADMAKNGAVEVDAFLRPKGFDDVYVIGDVSSAKDKDGNPLAALAPVAKQQGDFAARMIIAKHHSLPEPTPFRYRDWGTMATIGRSAAVGKFGRLEVRGFFAWLLWGAVHVAYLVGFRNRLSVMINWLWSWLTYHKGARLITGPDEADVQSLDSTTAVEKELDKTVTNLEESVAR